MKIEKKKQNYKTELHPILKNTTILFTDNSSEDEVTISFFLRDGEEGWYSEEFLPKIAGYEKKVDITCCIINKTNSNVQWYLYEVKKNLTGEDRVAELYKQLDAGYYYLKQEVLDMYIRNSGSIGVFTSEDFKETRLKNKWIYLESQINNLKKNESLALGIQLKKKEIQKMEFKCRCLELFFSRVFIHSRTKERFNVDLVIMKKIDNKNQGTLNVRMDN